MADLIKICVFLEKQKPSFISPRYEELFKCWGLSDFISPFCLSFFGIVISDLFFFYSKIYISIMIMIPCDIKPNSHLKVTLVSLLSLCYFPHKTSFISPKYENISYFWMFIRFCLTFLSLILLVLAD